MYAARLKDSDLLYQSSSGGVFTALSNYFFRNGDAVVCSIYNLESKQTEYRLLTCSKEQELARGSKYMQSIPGDIFSKSAEWLFLNEGKTILFIGTGCQTAGFLRYAEIRGFRDRVYGVDIICHGSPSPMIWRDYAEQLEKKNNDLIQSLTFKDKRNGWNSPTACVRIGDKEIRIDSYVDLFYSGCILRPACYKCPYATVNRDTDITIGDYWGIEKVLPDFYSHNGNSLILIHTEKGKQLFEKAKMDLIYRESSIKDCLQPNLIAPTPISVERSRFWENYHKHGLNYASDELFKPRFISRVRGKIEHVYKLIKHRRGSE